MANEAIADIFLQIADLLDLEGVAFKPEAYRRAARTLQQLPEDVADLVRSGKIGDVQGIGEALSEKIREFVKTGEVPYLAKLRAQWPPGLLELLRLEGLGPKTTRRFYLEFQVQGLDDLDRLLREGRLRGVKGFGDRKIELLQKAIVQARASPTGTAGAGRLPLPEAQALADELLEALRSSGAPVRRLVYAGSLRRRKETVGDLDILATSASPREVMERFAHLPPVVEVKLAGDTKSTVALEGGFQVDLRVVPDEAFGAALQYFTGSKDHNVRLRALANKKGFKINEYGLTREERLVPAPTEEEVYAAVAVPWIPPEMREDQGEIDAAMGGSLPPVVSDASLRAEFHVHVPASVEAGDLLPWAQAMKALGWSCGGFVIRVEDLRSQPRTMLEVRASLPREMEGVTLLLGLEETLRPTKPEERSQLRGADFLVGRLPEKPVKDVAMLRSWLKELAGSTPSLLAHLEPDLLAGIGLRWPQLLELSLEGSPVEVAVSHEQVVTETPRVREAKEAGAPLVLSGRPRLPEELPRLFLAAGIARRAWVPSSQVINTEPGRPWGERRPAPEGPRALTPRGKGRASPRATS